ncbi:flagellar type III secretion system pore protein FliP [Ramlibacter sp. WS9]|uniref:flagellar type III secretion system pore protein FliP n=1 Tax=Ramlibacter sp. WS9 TaxID=1882741 RepID=UPI001E3BBE4B|nr:flagellar type III secretion system pore protein FliP [Ramlibacter sp. WS9]
MRASWNTSAMRMLLASVLWFSACGSVGAQSADEPARTEAAATTAQQDSQAAERGADSSQEPARQAAAKPAPVTSAPTTAGAPDLGNKAARPQSPSGETAQAVRIVVGLTALAILPALLVCLTAFLRIIIVLSMLRHAIGMPETPPNTVLLGLALFLTLFTMSPVLHQLNQDALQPFMAGKLGVEGTYEKGSGPLREFMVRQTREQDLALMVELSKAKRPESMADISNVQLIPAFMLSELRAAFQIGFVIFLPFLLIDLIVSSVLMALGMMMMPPTTVALPLKILMFILVDGWSVVLKALMGSFH